MLILYKNIRYLNHQTTTYEDSNALIHVLLRTKKARWMEDAAWNGAANCRCGSGVWQKYDCVKLDDDEEGSVSDFFFFFIVLQVAEG